MLEVDGVGGAGAAEDGGTNTSLRTRPRAIGIDGADFEKSHPNREVRHLTIMSSAPPVRVMAESKDGAPYCPWPITPTARVMTNVSGPDSTL